MFLNKVTLLSTTQSAAELTRLASNGVYASHQLLWQLFPEDNERSFIYRQEEGVNGRPEFFVLSHVKPASNDTIFSVQTKPFMPKLNTGDRLAFKLTVNPTVCITDDKGKSRRHDVLMHVKKHANHDLKNDSAGLKIAMEHAAIQWISDRKRLAQWGMSFDALPNIESYTQHDSKKRTGHNVRFSSVDFQGILTITDPTVFLNQYARGFGRSKSMGCGLMMIRKI
ncbi:type I-E CRISPR-associated protein Cas6/Cse3/CasE [Psychrosphaera algicola]|uniref:Type I-E CRISPR-associated protein Cas6/Cse3/CasE n=1 Tax=Psychrosphaera algicola TaxID=3023714 RepID=A0ABT5FAF8_9GAMM|nr:type I-E CRISPR-associated protein Cas6/Cse3/CasE [Psychrosphaera sp. G1-22]MDC2888526.1 type I-E CRISPR-associated protein Cas6/Cse3/CasE [Psychrosphaera sp. G1-22]